MKKLVMSLLFLFFCITFVNSAFAQGQVGITPPARIPAPSINDVVRFVINVIFFIAVIGALLFIMSSVIMGALKGGGDKQAAENVKGQIVAAIIGLIIVILSYFILNLVLTLIGLPGLTNINIPTLGNPSQGPF